MAPIINMVGKKSIDCNQVAVIDATSSNLSSHHFVREEPMKEVSLEEMFQRMYKDDFNEASIIKLNSRVRRMQRRFSAKTGDSFR